MSKKNPNLTQEQKLVLFEEGTEPPGTSELNHEKREGSYYCANCDVKLFSSKDYMIRGETFDIVECLSCTLRITSPFPGVDTIGNYYNSEDYISHSDETKGLFEIIYKFNFFRFKIIFNSNWSKRRFLKGMKNDFVNSEKLVVVNQSAMKNNFRIKISFKYF